MSLNSSLAQGMVWTPEDGPRRTFPSDATGDVADATGRTPTATRAGGCTRVNGLPGVEFFFNGTGSIPTGCAGLADVRGGFSILFTAASGAAGGYPTWASAAINPAIPGNYFDLQLGRSGATIFASGAATFGGSYPQPADGLHHRYAFAFDPVAQSVALWIDGVSRESVPAGYKGLLPPLVGQYYSGGSNFTGTISNIQFWSRKLSDAELVADAADPRRIFAKSRGATRAAQLIAAPAAAAAPVAAGGTHRSGQASRWRS